MDGKTRDPSSPVPVVHDPAAGGLRCAAFERTSGDRQVIDSEALHELRGIVSSAGFARRATGLKVLDRASAEVNIGALQLRPLDRTAFGTAYRCGEIPVRLGALLGALHAIITPPNTV